MHGPQTLRSLLQRRIRGRRLPQHAQENVAVAVGQFAGRNPVNRAVGSNLEHAVDEAGDGHTPQRSRPSNLCLQRLRLPNRDLALSFTAITLLILLAWFQFHATTHLKISL